MSQVAAVVTAIPFIDSYRASSEKRMFGLQTSTPAGFEWIKRISYATYGYSALVKNEFQGLTLQEEGGYYTSDATELIPSNVQTELSLGANVAILFGILVALRIIHYIQMRISIATKSL